MKLTEKDNFINKRYIIAKVDKIKLTKSEKIGAKLQCQLRKLRLYPCMDWSINSLNEFAIDNDYKIRIFRLNDKRIIKITSKNVIRYFKYELYYKTAMREIINDELQTALEIIKWLSND